MIKAASPNAVVKYFFAGVIASMGAFCLPSSALADWRSDMGVFRIGVAANFAEPIDSAKLDLFRTEISKALKMPVEIFQATDASALIDATASSRIEYAIVSGLGYATLEELCACVTPLVAPVSGDGATSVRSALVVNSGVIKTLDQLSGKSIAIGPATSLTSNLVPLYEFTVGTKGLDELGVNLVETQSLEDALNLFKEGSVDAFFGWQGSSAISDRSFPNLMDEHLADFPQSAMAISWLSTPMRYGPHVVRNNLPKEAITALKDALLNLDKTAPLAYDAVSPDLAGGLKPVEKNDYRSAFNLVRAIADKAPSDAFLAKDTAPQ